MKKFLILLVTLLTITSCGNDNLNEGMDIRIGREYIAPDSDEPSNGFLNDTVVPTKVSGEHVKFDIRTAKGGTSTGSCSLEEFTLDYYAKGDTEYVAKYEESHKMPIGLVILLVLFFLGFCVMLL